MSEAKQQWLVNGHGVIDNQEKLWALCEQCQELLGTAGMVIAERALGNCIEPWGVFRGEGFDQKMWSRGRFFGEGGEMQWRSYGRLVRVGLLVDVTDEGQGQAVAAQLSGLGLDATDLQRLWVASIQLALQTNDDEYTGADVRSYGSEDEPSLFVRYCRVTRNEN